MKKYELINKEGAFFKSVYAKNLKKAREAFNAEFTGKFKIICTENDWEQKNVILK